MNYRLASLGAAAVLLIAGRRWLRDVRRWAVAYTFIGPRRLAFHFAAQRKVYGCIACGRLRLPHEVFFASGQCDDWELCEPCHSSGAR